MKSKPLAVTDDETNSEVKWADPPTPLHKLDFEEIEEWKPAPYDENRAIKFGPVRRARRPLQK